MQKNPGCESPELTITCSTEPELFLTEDVWDGRTEEIVECLSHAVASEQRGRATRLILR